MAVTGTVRVEERDATVLVGLDRPELDLGIMAGAGGNWRLAQLVGLAQARRMLYTGEVLDTEHARAAGLVDGVHPSEELLEAAIALAGEISGRSWQALELTKLALRLHRPATTTFDITGQALLFESAEKRERMEAFLHQRAERRAEQRTEKSERDR